MNHGGQAIRGAGRAPDVELHARFAASFAGASAETPNRRRQLRGAPDPERYPMLAAAAAAWTAARDRDTYLDDLGALIDALLAAARPRQR